MPELEVNGDEPAEPLSLVGQSGEREREREGGARINPGRE